MLCLLFLKQSWELFHSNSCIVEAKKVVREKMKEIAQKKRDEVSQVKRMKNPRACPHCPGFPIFESGAQKDHHLISSHNYDYCKICKVNLNLFFLLLREISKCSVDWAESECDAPLRGTSSCTALSSLWFSISYF